MSISITDYFVASNKGTATELSSIYAGPEFAVGDYLVVCLAADTDVVGTVTTSAAGTNFDTTYNAVTATNSGNVVTSILYARCIVAHNGRPKVINLTEGDAKACNFYKISGLANSSPLDKLTSAIGTSTSPSSGACGTLAQTDEVVIGVIGTEGPQEDTAGSWTTGDGYVSGNEERQGTTGSGANSNITVHTAAEVVSDTTAQTAAKTGITSRDWAAVVATFKAAAVATFSFPDTSPIRRLMHNLVR